MEKLNAMLGVLQGSWFQDPAGAKICRCSSLRTKCELLINSCTTLRVTLDHLHCNPKEVVSNTNEEIGQQHFASKSEGKQTKSKVSSESFYL